MKRHLVGLTLAISLVAGSAQADPAPEHKLVAAPGSAQIDVTAQGQGPLVVLLPSRGRYSNDFDALAAALAEAGYRVVRPQPRGIGISTGPMTDLTLHDLARDVAAVIEAEHDGKAVLVGHAFGNFVSRMVAVDRPDLVRGVVLAAAAGKVYPDSLALAVSKSGDPSLPKEERLKYLQGTFFAAGHDPSIWLDGWFPAVDRAQRGATLKTKQSEWWTGGSVPLLELQAEQDPFKTPAQRNELKQEFGDRVTVKLIPDASHALLPEQPKAVSDAIVSWMKTL